VEWLVDHGASVDEIERAATSDQLELLAGEVALRVGASTVSLSEAGKRLDLPVDVMTALWRAAGFVEREPDIPVMADAEIEGYFRVLALSLQRASMVELNALIRSFNEIAHSTVSGLGGRVVKLIGDEVMFVVPDADSACSAALEMLRRLRTLELEGRAGVAWGPVLTREGDYFGVPINVASRLTKLAQPGSVLLTNDAFNALSSEFRDDTRVHFSATEQATVRGFDVALLVRSLQPSEAPHPEPRSGS